MGKKLLNRFLIALLPFIFTANLIAQNQFAAQDTSNKRVNQYYSVQKMTMGGGVSIDKIIIAGPPKPPPEIVRTTVSLPQPRQTATINTVIDVPAFDWSFGCSATSAAMIAGYYDRHGYGNMYTGPTNSGIMPLDNSSWPSIVINGETRSQCPLSATRNGLDGRVTRGHVDDYWIKYNSTGPDPFVTNGWTEHTLENCTADFMKTSKWIGDDYNIDGGTVFFNFHDNSPLTAADMVLYGVQNEDGGYGIKLFYESRGYTVTNMYNQNIYGLGGVSAGFTYAQFKAEIDAGRPVIINLEGHTIVGIGYNDATNLVYIHDTWDYNTHTMTWGGTYSGMQQLSVIIVQLADPMPVELSTFTVSTKHSNAELQWRTETEVNNYGFEVERRRVNKSEQSIDESSSQWLKVGFVNGSGTSNTPHDYSVSDQNLAGGCYVYRLKQIDNDGIFKYSGSVQVEIENVPVIFSLEQNYPNPFNPSTTIRFNLPVRSSIKLEVINILGQTVATLDEGEKEAGFVESVWHSNVASGIYFYRLEAVSVENPSNRFIDVKKMMLLK